MATFPITTLTPSAIQQNLQADGLDTLGLTTFSVSPRWADAAVSIGDYDATALTLNIPAVRLPYRGILEYAFTVVSSNLAANLSATDLTFTVKSGDGNHFPTPTVGGSMLLTLFSISTSKFEVVECTARAGDNFTVTRAVDDTIAQAFKSGDPVILRLTTGTRTDSFYDVNCNPLGGPAAIYRLHPQAILRLSKLATDRYVTGANPLLLPIPFAMVIRGVEGFKTARWYEADELLGGGGKVSFHDARGLIIDPVYVACMFSDLQNWLAGLLPKSPVASNVAGGVQTIAALSSVTLVHCVDLHGAIYQPAIPGATLVTQNGTSVQTATVPSSGLFTLTAGDGLAAASTDNNRLRWGWATNGVLARTRLVPPPLTNPLAQQFYRAAIVDTTWALLGNRTAAAALGVDPDDQTIPVDILPVVRDLIVIDYLADGPDTMARSTTLLARANLNMLLTVSPTINGTMAVPSTLGAPAHWPAFPGPNTATGFPAPPVSPATGIAAAWASGGSGNDVVVTIPSGAAPDGAHVRIYSQVFVTIVAITADAPSFLRGDGGAAIAHNGSPTQVFLSNPFQLALGQPKPTPANLTMDIVVAPRNGNRKLWAGVTAAVATGPVAPPADPFGGISLAALVPPIFQAVAPAPLFGIPTTVTPPGVAPSGLIGFLRSLASEGSSPRQGPRLPTMARFETIVVSGTTGGTPPTTLLWEAVLSGGRWDTETRSAQHASGNPGNPAGPDVHAPGIHVTGALAYDLARHAMRRAQPIIPLPGSPTPGWLVAMDGLNFDPPIDSNAANTGIGVLLETTPAICETPELSLIAPPPPGATVQNLINNLATTLGIPAPTVSLGPTEPRMEREVRREVIVSTSGLRDALWSLHRALHDARELIYIESPQFARTAYPSGPPKPYEIDLISDILKALLFRPNLRLIVCTPRESDFAQRYKGWSRQHYKARNDAVSALLASVPDRVAIFHPVGFPGRPAFIRSTTVIVDDVWCLTGATHIRRRGMTFDGSAAIASFDRQMDNGYSKNVRAYRRNLMATKMAIAAPGTSTPSAEWLRLGHPVSAFQLVTDWLNEGGLGKIQPFWPGPADTTVLPATADMADPDGSNGANFITTFASLIAETGD
jgi:hypothetical protein